MLKKMFFTVLLVSTVFVRAADSDESNGARASLGIEEIKGLMRQGECGQALESFEKLSFEEQRKNYLLKALCVQRISGDVKEGIVHLQMGSLLGCDDARNALLKMYDGMDPELVEQFNRVHVAMAEEMIEKGFSLERY
jgi:hypothetical protein